MYTVQYSFHSLSRPLILPGSRGISQSQSQLKLSEGQGTPWTGPGETPNRLWVNVQTLLRNIVILFLRGDSANHDTFINLVPPTLNTFISFYQSGALWVCHMGLYRGKDYTEVRSLSRIVKRRTQLISDHRLLVCIAMVILLLAAFQSQIDFWPGYSIHYTQRWRKNISSSSLSVCV